MVCGSKDESGGAIFRHKIHHCLHTSNMQTQHKSVGAGVIGEGQSLLRLIDNVGESYGAGFSHWMKKVLVGKCESVEAIVGIQYAVGNFETILSGVDSEVKSTQPAT